MSKPFKVTDQQIADALETKLSNLALVANALGISYSSLEHRIAKNPKLVEKRQTLKKRNIEIVEGRLWQQIQKDNLTAIIFYLKTQGGWRESNHLAVGGDGGQPIKTEGVATLVVLPPVDQGPE